MMSFCYVGFTLGYSEGLADFRSLQAKFSVLTSQGLCLGYFENALVVREWVEQDHVALIK